MPVIVARRGGPCSVCRLPVTIGERIHYTRSTRARHLACVDDRDDPEDAIRTAYAVYGEGCTGLPDAQAFDLCVEEFGYVNTVKALYQVSPIAKQKEDAYQAAHKGRA